jgi:hypothetical protein
VRERSSVCERERDHPRARERERIASARERERGSHQRERERASARETSARESIREREREREHKPTRQLASQTTYLQDCGGDKGRERSREKEDVVHHRHRICFSFLKAKEKNENLVLAAL